MFLFPCLSYNKDTLLIFFFLFFPCLAVIANPDLKGTQRWRTISTVAPNHSLQGGKSCADQREATPSPNSWDISVSLYQVRGPIENAKLQSRSETHLAL